MINLNQQFNVLCSIFLIMSLGYQPAYGQMIEWQYEVRAKVKTSPMIFWADEEGNGFYNIRKINPDQPSDANYGSFLLMLDKNGNFKGTTYVKDCEMSSAFLPFGKNELLSSGYNCDGPKARIKDSRVFNYRGKLLRKGKAFPGSYFASIWSNDGFTFFSKPTEKWGYSFISIGRLDENLQISYDSVSLVPLKRPDLGIVNSFKDPVQVENGNWIVPMQYGKIKEDTGIRLRHGIVLGIEGDEIIWKYPDTLMPFTIAHVSAYADKIGVLMKGSNVRGSHFLALLDEDGNEIQHIYFRPNTRKVRDMILDGETIILLGTNSIMRYDFDGNLLSEFDLSDQNLSRTVRMQLLKDGSIIFTALRNSNVVIMKVNFGAVEAEIEADNQSPLPISYSSIERVSQKALSVSVFPNPTSININFELEKELEADGTFYIQIFDASGRMMHNDTFKDKFYQLGVSDFSSGTYIYKIVSNDEVETEFITGQFIKVD